MPKPEPARRRFEVEVSFKKSRFKTIVWADSKEDAARIAVDAMMNQVSVEAKERIADKDYLCQP